MTQERPMLVGAATVFIVRDIRKSIEHYRDALGFGVNFQYGQPTFYACLRRDEVALHLLASGKTKQLPGNVGVCVFVRDVDGVFAELAKVADENRMIGNDSQAAEEILDGGFGGECEGDAADT